MRFYLVILFTVSAFFVLAQEEVQADSTRFEPIPGDSVLTDTLDNKKVRVFRPGLYVDYGKLLNSVSSDHTKLEGGFEIIFWERVQLIMEFGDWSLSPSEIIENGDYYSEGGYWRYGLGYIPYVDAESRVGIGVRYGTSMFSESGNYQFEPVSGLQGAFAESFQRDELSASWYELVFYSDQKLNKWLTIGLTARLRFLESRDEFEPIDVQIIPGYGSPAGKRVGAVNLFLKIPL